MSAALDPLDALISITRFTSAAATFKSEKAMCLRDLAEVIVTSHAPEKEALLWLKLARFGTQATDRGSLRHNANVVEVTGIEGDYDGEVMSIDEAEARLREVDVSALIYTSPSHTDDKPRWRVLAPLSKGYPPADRERFLARLNGVLGGILSGESFTLSQSFYYGSIAGKPAPRLAWVEGGEFIDLLDDLDATAIGRKKTDDKPKTNGGTPHNEAPRSHATSADEAQRRYARAACDAEMDKLASTSKYRGSALARSAFVLGTLVGAGALSENDAVAALQDAIRRNGLDEKDGWVRVNACIDRQIRAGMASPRDMSGVGTRAGRRGGPPHPGFDEEPDEEPHPGPEREAKWSEPLPLFPPLPPPERYPIEALCPVLSKAAAAIARKVQLPEATAAQSVLAAAALAAQAHADVMLPYGQTRPLSLYFVSVAISGDRKTTADNEALWPIRKREAALREYLDLAKEEWRVVHGAWSGEKRKIENSSKLDLAERKTALREIGPEPRHPLEPILTTPDPTIEGLVKIWVNAPAALGIFTAEGGQFIGGYGFTADQKLKTASALSELWDGRGAKRVRVSDGLIILHGRRLSAHLMVQEDAATAFLADPVLRDQGLLSRVLVAAPESIAGTRFYRETNPEDERLIHSYGARLLTILEAPWPLAVDNPNELEPRTLTLTQDAVDVWRDFYDRVELRCGPEGDLRPILDFAAKAAEHAARIAGVLTIINDHNAVEINVAAMKNAITLASWYLNETLRLQRASRMDARLLRAQSLLDWLLKWAREKSPEIDFRQIVQFGPAPLRIRAVAEEAHTILKDHGWIRVLSKRPYRILVTPNGTTHKYGN